ncbi:MAG: diguanylate cyclase [Clostridiales bacterium]|nr:diguanylate cyclase [Clostridiales bacterium]
MMKLLSLYLFFAVILALLFAAYFFSKGRSNYLKAFSAMALCVSLYLFGYLMIINSGKLEDMAFWNQIQYLGLPFGPVLWLLVSIYYTKVDASLKIRLEILLFVIPVVTFVLRLTNPWHHFFYTNMGVYETLGYRGLYVEWGPWYYFNILYTKLCLIATVVIYSAAYQKNKVSFTRSHFSIFLLASLLPLAGIALVLIFFNELSVDYSAVFMPVSLFTIGLGIVRYDFLEIRTLARETIFEKNHEGMVVLGPGRRIIDYNKAAKDFFETLNIPLATCPIEQILDQKPELYEIFSSENSRDFSLTIDGEERFFKVDALPLGEPDDKGTKMLKSIRDVTEERRIQEKLKILATTDSLSGLNNRAEFMSLVQKELESAKESGEELALLIMDVDNFKAINDTFGHAAGDEVIRHMGNIIRSSFRKTDIPGRIGGEEFAVVLKNATLEEAKMVAEQVRAIIESLKVVYWKQEIRFTVSIGVAALRGSARAINNIEDIFKMADDMLYKAKIQKNCVMAWEPGSEKDSVSRGC